MKRWITAIGSLVVLALIVTAIWLYRDYKDGQADATARTQAVAAASTAAEATLSYAAGTASTDLTKSEVYLANPFKAQFVSLIPTIVKTATLGKISTSAVVAAAGVVRMIDPTHVVVLLFVNQNTTSGNSLQPVQQGSRVEVTMVKNNGRWLIANLKAI